MWKYVTHTCIGVYNMHLFIDIRWASKMDMQNQIWINWYSNDLTSNLQISISRWLFEDNTYHSIYDCMWNEVAVYARSHWASHFLILILPALSDLEKSNLRYASHVPMIEIHWNPRHFWMVNGRWFIRLLFRCWHDTLYPLVIQHSYGPWKIGPFSNRSIIRRGSMSSMAMLTRGYHQPYLSPRCVTVPGTIAGRLGSRCLFTSSWRQLGDQPQP